MINIMFCYFSMIKIEISFYFLQNYLIIEKQLQLFHLLFYYYKWNYQALKFLVIFCLLEWKQAESITITNKTTYKLTNPYLSFDKNIIALSMKQQIKQSRFKYAYCQGGGLHEGEILNLVCVDDKCMHRGLVCPVCKMETHNDHYILPIKHFLAQINELVANSQNSDDLTNLGNYLRTIQSTKRGLLGVVKQQINQLSNLFKEIQVNIQESYLSLRRNVLIQSSSSTKLPKLITLLTNYQNKDAFQLQNQFRKYCEMIKYKDGKLKITDKVSALVNSYKNSLHSLQTSAKSAIGEYKKKMLIIVNSLQSSQNNQNNQQKTVPFLFSQEDKHIDITVNQQQTQAWQGESSDLGIIFVNKPFQQTQNSVTFKIVKNQSYQILVGLADVQKLRECSFSNEALYPNYSDHSCMELFIISDGTTNLTTNGEDEEGDNSFCFELFEGDRITVKINAQSKECQFTKIATSNTFKLPLKSQILGNQNIRLCFGLGTGDKIALET